MSLSERLALVAPVRTPIGKFGGALASLQAAELGALAASACVERSGVDPERIDLAVFGHARQAGGGPNTARQVVHRVGLPQTTPAFTVNQACGSGLQAIFSAARHLRLGEATLALVGGTESMSNTPYLLPRARWGQRLGHGEIVDGMYRDGFDDPLSGLVMGDTAEELAEEAGIDRAASDAWAATSQNRCEAARARGRFAREIHPVRVETRGGFELVDTDEHPRDGITAEGIARMRPVFREDGRVTAANASGITDGAAALLITTEATARELGLEIAGFLVDWEVVGVDPRIMGIGPVPACRNLLARRGLDGADIDQVELNEAFACQLLACTQELPFDPETVNPDGGAIALGHPIGATGARILVTLLHGLAERTEAAGETSEAGTDSETPPSSSRRPRRGIATLCVSGGLGLAALVEVP